VFGNLIGRAGQGEFDAWRGRDHVEEIPRRNQGGKQQGEGPQDDPYSADMVRRFNGMAA
jgi:hypothetical protein